MVVVWFHSEYMGWGWGENLYFCLCSLLITYNCIDSIQVGIYIYRLLVYKSTRGTKTMTRHSTKLHNDNFAFPWIASYPPPFAV